MTELQEERIAECQAMILQVGLVFTEVSEADEEGRPIGGTNVPIGKDEK